MSENNNTPCGCRRNSANGTHMVEPVIYSRGGFVQEQPSANGPGHDHAEALNGIDDAPEGFMSIVRVFSGRVESELRGIKRFLGLCEVCPVLGLGDADAGADVHVSSPVVAESGAVTPDTPAMTVQEQADTVSPGVGGAGRCASCPNTIKEGA